MSSARERFRKRAQERARTQWETVDLHGFEVELRTVSAGSRLRFGFRADAARKANRDEDLAVEMLRLISESAHDKETGERLWQEPEEASEDLQDQDDFEALLEAAMRASGLDKGAHHAAKNGSGAADASSTASPATSAG